MGWTLLTVAAAAVTGVVHALDQAGLALGPVTALFRRLPLYAEGFGWAPAAAAALLLGVAVGRRARDEKRAPAD